MSGSTYEDRKAERSRSRGFFRMLVRTPAVRRLAGLARVGAYVGVVSVVVGAVAANSAWGSLSEQALVTGRQLAKLEEFSGASERMLINGQAINISSTVTEKTLEEVLDRFEGVCKEDGSIVRDFAETKGLLDDPELVKKAKGLNFGIIREQKLDDGIVACTVRNPANGKRSTFEGFGRFAETWDLADLGMLRYAYARRTKSGKTHVLTVWTDGSFRLDAMTPAGGSDAPGGDSQSVPRPPDAVRYLSAAAEGRPHGVRIYESKSTAAEVLAKYDRDLPAQGWQAVPLSEDSPSARYYSKNGVDVMLVADQSGDRSLISMVETRGF